MDLKERYQFVADRLAQDEYDSEFEDLSPTKQSILYNRAESLVQEELQEIADLRRKEVLNG